MIKLAFVFLMLFIFLTAESALSEVAIGVKEGDWIEYQVTTTGHPPKTQNVKWARMDIIEVQTPKIKINVTTQSINGTMSNLIMQLNLERGEVGAWFTIPSNLNVGDTFYDRNMGLDITIEGEEQKTYCNALRTVTNATTFERIKQWDKATGVFLISVDTFSDYSINATAIKTNMWTPQILGLDQNIFYTIIISVVIVIITSTIQIVVYGKRNSVQERKTKQSEIV